MARPVKWSRDLHPLRERAARARTETWSRMDIEELFGVARASAQSLMKAIGQVQSVGGAHFVERPALLSFLDAMIAANSVEEALRQRLLEAEAPPRPKKLRVSLPEDLRRARLPELPANISLRPGRLEIIADDAVGMLESLLALAMVMQNDLERFREAIELPQADQVKDDELRELFDRLRTSSLPLRYWTRPALQRAAGLRTSASGTSFGSSGAIGLAPLP